MSISRRNFVQVIGAGAAGSLLAPFVSGRGLEAISFGDAAPSPGAIRLDSNENPNGPGAVALDGIRAALSESNRYPRQSVDVLRDALAKSFGIAPDNLLMGCGSTDILRAAVSAFTSPTRALVTAAPSFENPAQDAERIGSPVRAVPVTGALALDLAAMQTAASGAGLVYLCNPNNPTATVHGADAVKDFIARTLRDAPDVTILVDEAYHEFVADPTYATMVPLALENPRVIVARTFSKVYGMAGLRVGYAIGKPESLKMMGRHTLQLAVNQLGAAAALAGLGAKDHIAREIVLNREAREFTRGALSSAGFNVGVSDANFIMVDVRRDPRDFRDACKAVGVLVGRPFPPLKSWARISIGTMDEMRAAVPLMRRVLGVA
ncbi:MAG: aminotransferase class I/II-fold pyridoxal phosphate-dependent enzyme [Gemmatimonadota bacterium]|nr:aminotransferase class I/II-fold pyridoxal phosphate-dependent enzyme [Gemmatimonadota bacterium]